MYHTFRIALAAAAVLIVFSGCKKKPTGLRSAQSVSTSDQPLATGFALKNAIAIQAAPELRSKTLATLPIGTAAAIYATRVPDKKEPDNAYWYKIKYTPTAAVGGGTTNTTEGFISEREEVLRQNFLIFEKKGEETVAFDGPDGKRAERKDVPAVMATTSVNLRKSPALNGIVIQTLKNGDVLKVIEASTSGVEIADKYAHWYLVVDEKGVTGYCFGGFLLTGLYTDLAKLRDSGFRSSRGWAQVTANDAKAYRAAQGKELFDFGQTNGIGTMPFEIKDGVLPKDTLLMVDGEVTGKGGAENRYRVLLRREVEYNYFESYPFYVPMAKVKFTRDYFALSKEKAHTVDAVLAADLNLYVGGDLNLQCTQVANFTAGAAPETRNFVGITAATGPAVTSSLNEGERAPCSGTLQRIALLAEEKDGKYTFLGKEKLGGAVFVDLDNDGVPELVSENTGMRGGYSLDIFALQGNRITNVFAWHGDRGVGCIELVFKDKQIVIDYADYVKEEMKKGAAGQDCKMTSAEFAERYKGLPFKPVANPLPYAARLENGKFIQVPEH